MIRLAAGTALVLAVALPGAARGQATVAGRWTTDYPTAVRNENGVEVVLGTVKAVLTLARSGDSLAGTWQLRPDSTAAPAPIGLHGTMHADSGDVITDPVDRRVNRNGDIETVPMATRYDFVVRGDSLVGTSMIYATNGEMTGERRPFTAVRVRP